MALGANLAALAVHLVDPNRPGSYGLCPLRVLTGLACPLCGGLRAVHALTHGELDVAWGLNPAVFLLLPLAVVAWGWWTAQAWRGPANRERANGPHRLPRYRGPAVRHTLPWVALASMAVFAVLRNLPAFQPHLAALT